jgi:hypothetical protein
MRKIVYSGPPAPALTLTLAGGVQAGDHAKVTVPTLTGFASLPAAAFVPGSEPSGSLVTGNTNGFPAPFADQPVQGFSGIVNNGDGTFDVLSDNGYGNQANSGDFLLRVQRLAPAFADNQVDVLGGVNRHHRRPGQQQGLRGPGQGATAVIKRLYIADTRDRDSDGLLDKTLLVDLMNIANPRKAGATFTFPFQTIEDVVILNEKTVAVLNDNNFPFSSGRTAGVADNNEWITIELPGSLHPDNRIFPAHDR